MGISSKNEQLRYDLLVWIDYLAQIDGKVLLQVGSPEIKDIKAEMLWVWLEFLENKGLIEVIEYPKLPIKPGLLGATENDWFVFNVKEGFRDYVDEVYRHMQLTIEGLSTPTFLAVLDAAYNIRRQLEVTKGKSVLIKGIPSINAPELKSEPAEFRARALNFLKEYGAIEEFHQEGSDYEVSLTRRYFDLTFQKIVTRAYDEGYAVQEEKPSSLEAKSDATDSIHIGPIDKMTLTVQATNYNPTNATLNLQGVAIQIQAHKKGRGSKVGESKKARLMRLLFDVNTFPAGVEFHRVLSVRRDQITPELVKKVKNYVADVRSDIVDKRGPDDLIIWDQTKVHISRRYLKN